MKLTIDRETFDTILSIAKDTLTDTFKSYPDLEGPLVEANEEVDEIMKYSSISRGNEVVINIE